MRNQSFLNPKVVLTSFCLLLLLTITLYPQAVNNQAQIQAEKFFSRPCKRCGEYYYYRYFDRGWFLYQCKSAPIISVAGKVFQPRPLSNADKLNGVDPLPVAWQGYAKISLGLCRYQYYGSDGPGYSAWGKWIDETNHSIQFWNKKGVWEFFNESIGGERYTPISCDDIPDANKKTEVKEPFWGGSRTDRDGSILTIPASYGKWFYLGTGPMSIKRHGGAYSRVHIDGSNQSRLPDGGGNVGVQNYALDAVAPNLVLGSVIAKVGKNGEPFQLFTEERNRKYQDSYEIKSNDEVYIAINDSYYGDNKGEHRVHVKGENICFDCSPQEPSAMKKDNSAQQSKTAKSNYSVRIYNVDDYAAVYVNDLNALEAQYNTTKQTDITGLLRQGENKVRLLIHNSSEGFTYGFEIFRDGKSVFKDECGVVKYSGCRGNSQKGWVYDQTITINFNTK